MPNQGVHLSPPEAAIVACLQEFAPYGVVTTDLKFRVRSWNRWMEIHSGLPEAAAIGRGLDDLFPDLAVRGLHGYFERALLGEVSVLSTALHGYLLPLPSPISDPEFKFMQQTGRVAPLRFENEIQGTIIVIEDVTNRELQALILRRQHERDEVLSWALGQLLKSGGSRRTIRELFYKIAEHFDFDTYFLYLLRPDRTQFHLHAAGGVPPDVEEQIRVLPLSSPSGQTLASLTAPTTVEHIDQARPQDQLLWTSLRFRACAILPMSTSSGPLGTLCFGSCSRAVLQRGELELLSTLAQYVAIALTKETTDAELRAAQAKLNQHANDLERQVTERTARLQEIIAELETFSYAVAHDLRAPIRALNGYCEVLLQDYPTAIPTEPKAIIERLAGACQRLDALTRDLLTFNQVSTQEIDLHPAHLDEILDEVLSLFPESQQTFVTVQKPFPTVLAHRALLMQCLSSLIDNALKFVAAGKPPKVVIRAEHTGALPADRTFQHVPFHQANFARNERGETSAADPSAAQQWVKILVEDNGIGVAPDACQKIFGIFERGTSSSAYHGTGIGLALVARAMQRMGGFCGVEPAPGMGSRFWLALRAAELGC